MSLDLHSQLYQKHNNNHNSMTIIKYSLFALLLVLTLAGQLSQQKVIYLYVPPQEPPKNIDLSDIRNSPEYAPINCQERSCAIYKVTDFPAMLYWKGPGSAFERIMPGTEQAVRAHLLAKEVGAFNKFRRWIEDWSQLQTFIYSIIFASFLYTVFTLLFSPPKSQTQQTTNFQNKHKSKRE